MGSGAFQKAKATTGNRCLFAGKYDPMLGKLFC
jgi:hypothetical protein